MALKKIELPTKRFKFSDGQEVELRSPTLAQIQNAQKSNKDDIEQAKMLLVEMSDGELDQEFLNSLPAAEWVKLSECVSSFMSVSVKN